MLLPSAFNCEANSKQPHPARPKLPSFQAYRPQSPAPSSPGSILASCRALQAILGGPLPTQLPSSPIAREQLRNPFDIDNEARSNTRRTRTKSEPKAPTTPPRGANKRGRDEFEEDLDHPMRDAPTSQSTDEEQTSDLPSTPKRRRRIPLSMPLGLSATDFETLQSEHTSPVPPPPLLPHPTRKGSEPELDLDFGPSSSCSTTSTSTMTDAPATVLPSPNSDSDSGYGPSPPIASGEWSPEDDRMLVETVLTKLRLTKREWNDCARRLGKDKDSLGRRWNLLVGEGNVGLRRGRAPISRTDLDIHSW